MSKNNFALYFLNYFYITLLANRFLNILDININPRFFYKTLKFKNKSLPVLTEFYTVDFYFYISSY